MLVVLHLLVAARGRDSEYVTQAKAVVGFRFRGELAKNEVVPVEASHLPQSLHHIVFGIDGLLYASSFLTSEVFRYRGVCGRGCLRFFLLTAAPSVRPWMRWGGGAGRGLLVQGQVSTDPLGWL